MADQLQLRGGTTNEHSTFTGALREVTVDTDKDTLIVHDAATAGGHPLLREDGSNSALSLGTQGTPSLKFTGDTNTGIYSPGADQVAISTGGSGRLFVDASGRVGVGGSPTAYQLESRVSGNNGISINNSGNTGTDYSVLDFTQNGAQKGVIYTNNNNFTINAPAGPFYIQTNGSNALVIDSSQRVGIGTSSPSTKLEVSNGSITAGSSGDVLIGRNSSSFPSPGAGYFKLGTNNSDGSNGGLSIFTLASDSFQERVRVDSSGRVGVGTTSPATKLAVIDTNGSITFGNSSSDEHKLSWNEGSIIVEADPANLNTSSSIQFKVDATERLRIDSSGRVGVGTSSPAERLHLSGVSSWIRLDATATGGGNFMLGSSEIGGSRAFSIYDVSGSAYRLSINSAGNVGIGTTSPGSYDAGADDLVVVKTTTGAGITIHSASTHGGNIYFADGSSGTQAYRGRIEYKHSNDSLCFGAASASSQVVLDSAGRLLVNTSSNIFSQKFQVATTDGQAAEFSRFDTGGGGPELNLISSRNATIGSHTIKQSGDGLGRIWFRGSDGSNFRAAASISADVDGTPGTNDMPGRLVFSTTADGASSPTERMRITQDGRTYLYGSPNLFISNTASAGTSQVFIAAGHSATSATSSTLSFRVYNNGNVQNTNNSYGAISDIKLKENIVDASSQWDDLKAIQVRNYNFKEETGQQTHTQLGVVAQEVELVSPGLVTESPDTDDEGNDLGTVTKSVNYSVLYMKAVKALQEAMERIETLEAKVSALEAN